MTRITGAILLMFCCLFGNEAAWAQSLRGLGTLGADSTGYSYSFATSISANGGVVVGESSSPQGTEAFMWTGAHGMSGLGALGPDANGIFYSRATGVSSDGTTVVGQSSSQQGYEAFVWSSGTGMVGLGTLGTGSGSYSYPTGVSADGKTVVGDHANGTNYDAFVWSVQRGMIRLGTPPADDGSYSYSRAAAVSADGLTVVGERTNGSRSIAVVWAKEGEHWIGSDLVDPPVDGGPGDTRATGVSADGLTVVGQQIAAAHVEAFVWFAPTDELIGLGTLERNGHGFSEAAAISADGSTVVGESHNGSFTEAFLWTGSAGMIGLGTLGGDSYANGVSQDGSSVAGFTAVSEGTQAYLWTFDTGQVGLGTLGTAGSGFMFSVGNGISADGSTVFGHSLNQQGRYEAFIRRAGEAIEVLIDVDPQSDKNKINLRSQQALTVAILTTEDFDAATVDPNTLVLCDPLLVSPEGVNGGSGGPTSGQIADVDGDGDGDLLLAFDTQTLVEIGALDEHTRQVQLDGQTFGGISVVGTTAVTILSKPKKTK